MVALRHEDHAELHRALLAAGETPDENGSFMTTVHETVVSVRAAITGISEKTLPAFISGEEEIVKLYDEAIKEAHDQRRASDIFTRQRANLITKISEMKRLAAWAPGEANLTSRSDLNRAEIADGRRVKVNLEHRLR
ncbi:DUF2383 domain-containing protein [Bradyrhizobium jicamae]|uniref:DUF2383 domain-containing protein n=1 Tax=Bradyrhizobium jicamae TaxID=280332 RepID=UPI0020111620|nr:DUF2383 domain-containing protein [Bradyrhizobium jicamae]